MNRLLTIIIIFLCLVACNETEDVQKDGDEVDFKEWEIVNDEFLTNYYEIN